MSGTLRIQTTSCYKPKMTKTIGRWLLLKCVDGEIATLAKPFKTKKLAEKARLKYPAKERKTIIVGMIRIKHERFVF
jgi:hypothetical protein